MKIIPSKIGLLVKPIIAEEVKKSGIILAKPVEKQEKGEILAVGNLVADFKVGDKIFYKKWSPEEIEVDNQKLVLIIETDILAKFEE